MASDIGAAHHRYQWVAISDRQPATAHADSNYVRGGAEKRRSACRPCRSLAYLFPVWPIRRVNAASDNRRGVGCPGHHGPRGDAVPAGGARAHKLRVTASGVPVSAAGPIVILDTG